MYISSNVSLKNKVTALQWTYNHPTILELRLLQRYAHAFIQQYYHLYQTIHQTQYHLSLVQSCFKTPLHVYDVLIYINSYFFFIEIIVQK